MGNEELNIQQKRLIAEFRTIHPEYAKMKDEEIISILAENDLKLGEKDRISLFLNKQTYNLNEGLVLEHYNPSVPPKKQLKNQTEQLTARLEKVQSDLQSKIGENRLFRSAWHRIKNGLNFGANSKKVEQALANERNKISQIKNPEVFMELTGAEYTEENFEKLLNGEIKFKSEQALEAYKQGQDGVVDFLADMASGIVALGIYTAAVAAAPFTGGVSIAVGFAAATAVGAGVKLGIKAGGAAISGKEYTKEELRKDALTGAFSGALGPLTGGLGGAVGKSLAVKFGIQAVKAGVKDVAVTGAKQGFKQGLKTALVNPAGYEYTAGTKLFEKGFISGIKNLFTKKGSKIVMAYGAEMAVDGTLGGAIDGGFRAGLENDWDSDAMLSGAAQGGVGGAIMSPAIGGGMKLTGKFGYRIGEKFKLRRQISKKAKIEADNALLEKYKNYELPNGYKMTKNIAKSLEKDQEMTLKILSKFVGIPDDVNIIGKKLEALIPDMRLSCLQLLDEFPDNMYADRGTMLSIIRLAKLKHTNLKKYNEIVESSFLDDIKKQKITLSGDFDIAEPDVHLNSRLIRVSKEFNKKGTCIKKLSTAEELNNISKYVENGEVCEFDNVLYVNDNGKAEKINLSREKFEKLFPPIESNSFCQGRIGDCWLVSFLDGLMSKPNGRVTIYKLFEEQGDDIYIRLKDVGGAKIVFKDGKVVYTKRKYLGFKESNQALGLQMIEQSVACGRMGLIRENVSLSRFLFGKDAGFVDYNIADCANPNKLMKGLKGGWAYEAQDWLVGLNAQNKFIYQKGLRKKKLYSEIETLIKRTVNNDYKILWCHFANKNGQKKIMKKYSLRLHHAYTIKNYDPIKRVVHIANPHNTALYKEIPIDDILKYIEVGSFDIT